MKMKNKVTNKLQGVTKISCQIWRGRGLELVETISTREKNHILTRLLKESLVLSCGAAVSLLDVSKDMDSFTNADNFDEF